MDAVGVVYKGASFVASRSCLCQHSEWFQASLHESCDVHVPDIHEHATVDTMNRILQLYADPASATTQVKGLTALQFLGLVLGLQYLGTTGTLVDDCKTAFTSIDNVYINVNEAKTVLSICRDEIQDKSMSALFEPYCLPSLNDLQQAFNRRNHERQLEAEQMERQACILANEMLLMILDDIKQKLLKNDNMLSTSNCVYKTLHPQSPTSKLAAQKLLPKLTSILQQQKYDISDWSCSDDHLSFYVVLLKMKQPKEQPRAIPRPPHTPSRGCAVM